MAIGDQQQYNRVAADAEAANAASALTSTLLLARDASWSCGTTARPGPGASSRATRPASAAKASGQ